MIDEIWPSTALLGGQKFVKLFFMQAQVELRNVDGNSVTIVHLIGKIETESVLSFRRACEQVLPGQRVLFSFLKLSFVGSVGLRGFLQAMHQLAQNPNTDVRFCSVGPDFKTVLAATPLRTCPAYGEIEEALLSFQSPLFTNGVSASETGNDELISLTEEGAQSEPDLSVG